ncbi:MAG TPA: hypothetical protein VFC99_06095 [Acidimicrobiia bacterium]|nr:hypothetical protein [Acidimicrobiia bacterium]
MTDTRERRPARPRLGAAVSWLHWATLAGAFVVLVWLNRHHWFVTDEWNALADRRLIGDATHPGIWDPHNEHWSTIPVLVYRGLFTLFGARTYLPYVVVLLLVHLTVVHLLWRVMLRVGVEPLLATVLCGVFAVLGAASDDLFLAWQWQLVGPLAFGLAALLLTPRRGGWQRRDAVVWLLLVLGLMCSGVAITMTAVVGLVVLLRRGWQLAIATVAVPAAAYGLWYVTYGHKAVDTSEPLGTALRKAPAYIWQGYTGALDATIGFEGVATAVIVALGVWLFLRAHPTQEPWPIPVAMAGGAALFLFLTDLRRSGLGIDQASTSRYVYVTIALILPVAALALDALIPRGAPRLLALAALSGLLLLVQIPLLRDGAAEWANLEQPFKHRIMATAQLAREHARILSPVPVPVYIPNLTVDKIAALDRDEKLPGNVRVTAADVRDARNYLQLLVSADDPGAPQAPATVTQPLGATMAAGPGTDCVTVTPTMDAPSVLIEPSASTSFEVTTGQSGAISVTFEDADGRLAPYRTFPAVHGVGQFVRTSAGRERISLVLPGNSPTQVCGVTPG